MVIRRTLFLLAVAAFATGCSSSYKDVSHGLVRPLLSAQQRATVECKGALRNQDTFATAQPTTIGAIHRITGGPRPTSHPWSNLYQGQPDDAFAAWCWRSTGLKSYQSYVVGPGSPIFLNVRSDGIERAPVGPVAIT